VTDPPDRLPDGLPETSSPKEPVLWWPAILAALLGALVLVILLVNAWQTLGFSSREDSSGGGVEDIVVSARESPYLPADAERFGSQPGAVYVYVVVRRMPSGERLRVRVERESADSVLGRLLFRERSRVAIEPLQTRPGPGENLDVARFVLSARSGKALPPGRYTISVYRESKDQGARLDAREFFQIRG